MGWAALFVASAGTGVAGMLLCGLLGILYTLGFILASAGEDGHLSDIAKTKPARKAFLLLNCCWCKPKLTLVC